VSRETNRLLSFSDSVFAITITLLVLDIRPPSSGGNLLHGLVSLWPSYLAYVVTFLFIQQVWVNHHVMFDHIGAANRVVLLLNTLLLMAVAFLPFATSVLGVALHRGHDERTAIVFYGMAFDLTALTFNAVWQYASRRRLLSEALGSAGATAISRRFRLALAWLAAGAVVGGLVPLAGLALIAAFNASTGFRFGARVRPTNRQSCRHETGTTECASLVRGQSRLKAFPTAAAATPTVASEQDEPRHHQKEGMSFEHDRGVMARRD
jgi:uncharacterized membrane protein